MKIKECYVAQYCDGISGPFKDREEAEKFVEKQVKKLNEIDGYNPDDIEAHESSEWDIYKIDTARCF